MSLVQYSIDDSVCRITLNDPERGNPLDQPMVDALLDAVRRARADRPHVLLLTGAGRGFSVGGDVRAFHSATHVEHMIDDLADTLHRVISELQRSDTIVVSAVRGAAAGAGLSLAATADIVLAASSARFTVAYTKIGLSPDGGASLLTASLGLHRALHLALLNPVLTAQQAHAAGLVSQVHPDSELDAAADEVAKALRAGSRTAQAATKRLLRDAALPTAETALRREALSIRRQAASADGREGAAAFLDKRPPNFTDPSG